MRDVVIVDGVRTAIGNYGGSLKDIPVAQLGAIVIKQAMVKAGLRPLRDAENLAVAPSIFADGKMCDLEAKYWNWDESLKEVKVDEVIMGNVLQAGQGQNTARQAMIYAGLPKEVNAYTINKICASGLKAVSVAAQVIKAGDADVIIAGGQENMSAAPYVSFNMRWGARMNDVKFIDQMVYDGVWEVFNNYHMGITSENIAEKYNISREEQDTFALTSNNRALAAIKDGVFKTEIVPVEVKVKKAVKVFDTDEHPRETSLEAMAKLPTAFKKDGTVTAGNASGITDAAAALVVMSAEKADSLGLKPRAVIRSYAAGGVDPAFMGLGPVPAIKKALKLAGLTLADIDLIELNEAFASQSLGCIKELDINQEITNIYGGGISLGHPIGCTGARILVTLMNGLERTNKKYGLASLCIGGGQGMAMIIERI